MAVDLRRILVIRLGALGDFVLSFGPFAAIRRHHAADRVTLLTTRPFVGLAELAPWFDAVAVDHRPPVWNIPGVLRLRSQLRGYDMIYDLQTSARSNRYHLLAGQAGWSGIAPGCSHLHANPDRDRMHTWERQRDQLAAAGVIDVPRVDLSWLTGARAPAIESPFALLVPGASPRRPAKRWPAARYGALAARIAASGVHPVVVGSAVEAVHAATIRAVCPAATDLTGQTDLPGLAALAARAAFAVGNDTGPMHLAAAAGCRSVVLFGPDSDPALTAPRMPDGGWPTIVNVPDLAALPVEQVAAALPCAP